MQKDDKILLFRKNTEPQKADPQHDTKSAHERSFKINQNAIHKIIQLDAAAWLKLGPQ